MAEAHIPPPERPPLPPPVPNHNHKKFWLYTLTAIFVIAGLLWLLYYIFIGRFYVSTEDAYVHGNEVMLTPEVSGNVKVIYADETDLVDEGQVVVSLDPTDYQLVLDERTASLGEIVRRVVALFDDVKAKEAMVALRKAELAQNELDYFHRKGLIDSLAVSLEEFEQSETAVEVSIANLQLAEVEFERAKAQVEGTNVETHPLVEEAIAATREAYLNLLRCEVRAPSRGYVAKRRVQVGEHLLAGQEMLAIVPLDSIWGEANYKETQLKKVRIGQPVRFRADLYGRDFDYEGRVIGFTAGTGDAFAILPAQNASGNWIKIIQRLPIRFSIPPEALIDHPLMIGLSLRVHIDVTDTSGKMLTKVASTCPVYCTRIFDRNQQLEAFNEKINAIVMQNYYEYSQSDDCNDTTSSNP